MAKLPNDPPSDLDPRDSALVQWEPPAEQRDGRQKLEVLSPGYDQLHLVWVQLRKPWTWLALVPADPDFSTARLAQALSDVGARLSVQEIGCVEAVDVDLDSASQLIGRLGSAHGGADAWPAGAGQQFASESWGPPAARTLVALESPLKNPLALTVALAADGVILCVRRGQTRLADLRATVETVGADRIVCTLLLD